MRIKIVTKDHEYQGLYYDTVIEGAFFTPFGVEFTHKGKHWAISGEDYLLDCTGTDATKQPDAVNHPKHYAVFEQLEAIEVIASSMTLEQFYGYCLGNILKYRLRVGGKDDVMQELGKVGKYQELFTNHKHLCKDIK